MAGDCRFGKCAILLGLRAIGQLARGVLHVRSPGGSPTGGAAGGEWGEQDMKIAIAYRDASDFVVRVIGMDGTMFANTALARKAGYEVLYR